jgi:hypothetical protein
MKRGFFLAGMVAFITCGAFERPASATVAFPPFASNTFMESVTGHSQGGNLATWILKNKDPYREIAFSAPSYTLGDSVGDEAGPGFSHAGRTCTATRVAPHEFTGNTHVANLRAFSNTYDPTTTSGTATAASCSTCARCSVQRASTSSPPAGALRRGRGSP